jgi:hypothetical protein
VPDSVSGKPIALIGSARAKGTTGLAPRVNARAFTITAVERMPGPYIWGLIGSFAVSSALNEWLPDSKTVEAVITSLG